jgi:hypothetical protein
VRLRVLLPGKSRDFPSSKFLAAPTGQARRS